MKGFYLTIVSFLILTMVSCNNNGKGTDSADTTSQAPLPMDSSAYGGASTTTTDTLTDSADSIVLRNDSTGNRQLPAPVKVKKPKN